MMICPGSLKIDSRCDMRGAPPPPPLPFLFLFPVTVVLWKRSKCVIWNASVWSLWSRLFAEPQLIICDVSQCSAYCVRSYCRAIGRACLLMRMWNCVICIIIKKLGTKQSSSHYCMIALFCPLLHLQKKFSRPIQFKYIF